MDEKELPASDFIQKKTTGKKRLEIICILERGKKHHSYKIIRNSNHFSFSVPFQYFGNGCGAL